jgi:hypothetical protein
MEIGLDGRVAIVTGAGGEAVTSYDRDAHLRWAVAPLRRSAWFGGESLAMKPHMA